MQDKQTTETSDIPVVQYKHGEQLLETCDKCDGCGRIASDEDGTPWTYWESLPPGADLAVKAGIVRPLTCPKCGGLGKVVKSK